MKEDIERLYASNIRMSVDAYRFLLAAPLGPGVLHRLLNTSKPILTLDEVQSILSESAKIPSPPSASLHAPSSRAEPARAEPSPPPAFIDPFLSIVPPLPPLSSASAPAAPSPSGSSFAPSLPTAPSPLPSGPLPGLDSLPAPASPPPLPHPLATSAFTPDRLGASLTPAPPPLPPEVATIEVLRAPMYKPLAKEYGGDIVIHEHRDISGQSRCVGSVADFVSYFRDRFQRLSRILRAHPVPGKIHLRLDQLGDHAGKEARLIVMVREKRITKNGNLYLEFEDEYGGANGMVSSNERCFAQAKTVLKDDIVALDGRVGPNFFIVKAITWPDMPVIRHTPKAERDLAVAYLSDIHVGSRYFLEKPFLRFIDWLWGREGREELAGKVKYVVVAGDIADGIGVYPTQERELTIKDIYKQYEEVDRLVELMPDWIDVILSPGNHDAVRRGEPQPIIPMEMIKSDVKKIGSPSMVSIEGFKHLVYHGTSMDSMIANVSGLSYAKPEGPMLEMLKRRHLSPIYGENLIVPELHDYMAITEEPDVVHMGHVHKNSAIKYRGTLLVNSGTFQERTDFQVRMGHIPTPGIVPIHEFKTGQVTHLKFLEDAV